MGKKNKGEKKNGHSQEEMAKPKYTLETALPLLRSGKLMYTTEVPGAPDVPGEGKPRRSVFSDELITSLGSGVSTLHENFQKGLEIAGNKNCFGYRPMKDGVAQDYVWMSYKQVGESVQKFAAALSLRGFKKGDMIGIYSINCIEWVLVEQACNASTLVTVPLYDTLGVESIVHIVTQTEMRIVFSAADKVSSLTKNIEKLPSIKTIVVFGEVDEATKEKGKEINVEMISFSDFEREGKDKTVELTRPVDTDLATIMYTSGTTGLPKGVMLNHRCLMADCGAVEYLGKCGVGLLLNKDDVHLSYLPLAHVFERMVVTYLLGVGGAIGFFQGSPLKLLDDLAALKPTIFPSVPRLLNRIYSKITDTVEATGGLSATLFNMALNSKKEGLKNGHITHWIWDKLVFSKTKARLGGRVRAIITASAPISPEVLDFLRIAFCCEVFEAYVKLNPLEVLLKPLLEIMIQVLLVLPFLLMKSNWLMFPK